MGMIPEILELKDVLTGDLKQHGRWLVASVNARMSWTLMLQKVIYRGAELWVLPITKQHYPGVAFNRPVSMARDAAERLLLQFCSSLAWIENGGILVEHMTENPRVMPMGRPQRLGYSVQNDFDFSYLPEPTDEKRQLALAIMREARALNHPAYAFLSFYRVLEIAFEDGRARGAWMSKQIDQIADPRVKEVIAQLRSVGVTDVGVHLQTSGRQAIAHARHKPIINPDDPADHRRLSQELPLIEALAVRAIDGPLGIETRSTVWQKHLYELAGFKPLLGADVVAALARGDAVNAEAKIDLPMISIELRRRAPYRALIGIEPMAVAQEGSILHLRARSKDECIRFQCHLDFANERLHFDVFEDLRAGDDGTVAGAERLVDVNRFIYDYLCNGELRILNAATNELLSRKDAFIPMNCYVNDEACQANIDRWEKEAQCRRSKQGL
jgi:hypothetical protein